MASTKPVPVPGPVCAQREKIALAFFLNTEVRAGVEEHVLSLLRGLNRERFHLFLVAPPTLCALYGADLPADTEVLPLRLSRLGHWRAMRELFLFLRARRIQILHSHLFYASLFASPIARLAGTPLILETPHVREQWRRGWIKRRFFVDRAVARCVHYFIAVSEANARYLVHSKGYEGRKIVIIPNGRNLLGFRPGAVSERQLTELRAALDLAREDPVLSIIARLEPQKGHRVLLQALPQILRQIPRLKVCLVGDGTLRQPLRELVKGKPWEAAVKFVGYQENILPWIALSDLVVLPSFYEGLPLVAIEALAMEKGVVATAVDGTPEVVVNEKTGLTVPPGDPDALAKAIVRLLKAPAQRTRLARAGRQHVLEHFSEDQQVARTEAFYLSTFEKQQQGVTRPWPLAGGRSVSQVWRS